MNYPKALHTCLLPACLTLAVALPSAYGFEATDYQGANFVRGQADFTTGFVDFSTDPTYFGARTTAADSLFMPADVALDEANERLFVADMHNHRVLIYDLSGGSIPDTPAHVLGQTDFTTGGVGATAYGNLNSTNSSYPECATAGVNPCGMTRVSGLAYDGSGGRDLLFVADFDNHRVMVFDLAGGIADGMPATTILGQANGSTRLVNYQCGGASGSGANACGLHDPYDIAIDTTNNLAWVSDADNHRVVGYDLSALATGMAAGIAFGQGDLLSRTPNMGGATSAAGLNGPAALAVDTGNQQLYVSDLGNNRIAVFDLAGAVTGDNAASAIGQKTMSGNAVNEGCGANGAGSISPCGIGPFGASIAVNSADGIVYVGDAAHHRVVTFTTGAGTPTGSARQATAVLGQPDYSSGYNAANAAFGGATSREDLLNPLGMSFNSVRDELVVADGGNHRLIIFGANIGGTPVVVDGGNETESTAEDDGSTTVTVVEASEDEEFEVNFPPNTTGDGDGDIEVTVDNPTPWFDVPFISISANLEAGQTKSITLPIEAGESICIRDNSNFQTYDYAFINFLCPAANRYIVPAAGVSLNTTAVGDPGDNPNDPDDDTGTHDIVIRTAADGLSVTVEELLHTHIHAALSPAEERILIRFDRCETRGRAGCERRLQRAIKRLQRRSRR